jgi:hypothetical protein
MTTTTIIEKRSIEAPDEVLEFANGRVELLTIGGTTFARSVFQPGWRWSESVKPIVHTESCELPHAAYVVSGAMHIRMDDGRGLDVTAGDLLVVGPGHDAWVTSDEPCVLYDFGGEDADYAKPAG